MFKVGQKVFSAAYGEGVVIEVVNMLTNYPVLVKFNSGFTDSYTREGRLFVFASNPDLVVIP